MTAPKLTGVLETVLYYTDEEETFRFYTEVLGMRSVGRTPGRQIFLRAGSSMLLLFDAEATRRPGSLPPHGATGPGHVCFLVPFTAYDLWRNHLAEAGVELLQDVDWPVGRGEETPLGSSFYFRDPSGNLLEIANADFWPR